MFETGVVRAIEGLLYSQARKHNRDIFSIFFNMKVYCVFSLESPQRGNSNEYTQHTICQYKKENYPNLSQICNYGICSKGLKNEFETAVVNEPSVFEPSKFYCSFEDGDFHIEILVLCILLELPRFISVFLFTFFQIFMFTVI